jgi:flagellar export protein FliJ
MRSRETVLRLQRFRTEEKRRQAQDLEAMIADFMRKYDDLDALVKAEEAKNGVTDPTHFNYSMSAKSARVRRDNLLKSISELKDQHADAVAAYEEQQAELKKVELLAEKETNHTLSQNNQTGFAGAHAR